MKRILIILFLISSLFSASIDIEKASEVARFFYESRSNNVEINSIIEVEEDNKIFMYIYQLSPMGFIIVSADDIVMPILGYSFENNFSYEEMPVQVDYLLYLYKENINTLGFQKWDDGELELFALFDNRYKINDY